MEISSLMNKAERIVSLDALRGFDMFWISGGWSLILLAIFYLIIDVWKIRRWSFPFVVIGLNAITIYIISVGIIDFRRMNTIFFSGIIKHFSAPAQPVIGAIGVLLLEWGFLFFLYRKKIFLKV
jgi:predicted acyltransferase